MTDSVDSEKLEEAISVLLEHAENAQSWYRDVLREIARLTGSDETEVLGTESVERGGRCVRFVCLGENPVRQIRVVIDFGEIPEGDRADIYRAALMMNLLAPLSAYSIMGLLPDPERFAVGYSCHLSDDASAEALRIVEFIDCFSDGQMDLGQFLASMNESAQEGRPDFA